MTSSLDRLRHELARPLPHPGPDQLQEMTRQVASWLLQYHASLPEQAIGKSGTRAELEALLREPPPEDGQEFARVLGDFQEKVAPFAFRVNHPRFLAFVPSAPSYVSILGDMLCAGTNFFAGVWLEASAPAQVELLVLDWFKEFLGYPRAAQGLLTGGGSEANLSALVVARSRLAFTARCRAVVYVSDQRHWSIDRAAKIIGLGADQVHSLPTTAAFTLDPQTLAERVDQDRAAGLVPWLLVANAGTTSTGSVDPLAELGAECRRQGLWLHVDAAYGWPAVLIPEGKAALAGIGDADSITLDPHKWFAQTFEAGCLLVREGRLLSDTFTVRPDYTQDVVPADDEVNFADLGLALTRRFRALKIWFSLKVLGVAWFRQLVERCCRLADLAECLLRASPSFEILCPRQLGIVNFRYVPAGPPRTEEELNRLNLALVEALRKTGKAFLSSTLLRGRVSLRFCFVNWRTTANDVETVIGLLEELGAKLT